MRNILFCAALTFAALLPARVSQAYEGPWCAVLNLGNDLVSENCSMPSFEVCREEAMHFGSSSFCRQNPGYPGYWTRYREPNRHGAHNRRHHHRHRRH